MIYSKLIIIVILIILFTIINNYFLNSQENYTGFKTPYFFDALKKNDILSKNNKDIVYCKTPNNCIKENYSYHFNSPEAVRFVKDKIKTSSLLSKNKIPVPRYKLINIYEPVYSIMKKDPQIQYPVIVKPINGTFGLDVHINIENDQELQNVLNELKNSKFNRFMMEEYIEGDVYRIFVFKNKIIDIVKREKPYVIGNGNCNLKKLIENKNEKLIQKGLFPTNNLSSKYLAIQGVNMNSIIPVNKKIYISQVINMHNGAPIQRIDISKVPQINQKLFIDVGKSLKINCYGLDYISKDISQPFNEDKNVILEVNGTPDTEIHSKLDNYGSTFFENIVNQIFK